MRNYNFFLYFLIVNNIIYYGKTLHLFNELDDLKKIR